MHWGLCKMAMNSSRRHKFCCFLKRSRIRDKCCLSNCKITIFYSNLQGHIIWVCLLFGSNCAPVSWDSHLDAQRYLQLRGLSFRSRDDRRTKLDIYMYLAEGAGFRSPAIDDECVSQQLSGRRSFVRTARQTGVHEVTGVLRKFTRQLWNRFRIASDGEDCHGGWIFRPVRKKQNAKLFKSHQNIWILLKS